MTSEKETALAIPGSYTEISNMAKAFVASGMFTDTKQLSQAIVKIQAGRELGLPPVYSMQNINLIRNRLTTSANTMAMLVKKSGNYDYRIKEHNDKVCTISFHQRDGEKWEPVGDSTFTIEDAKRAELVKPDSGWVKYPRAMLFSRAISQGARIYAPDAIGGVYTDEEIRSIPARPDEGSVTITENVQLNVQEYDDELPPPAEAGLEKIKESLEPSEVKVLVQKRPPEATESTQEPVEDKNGRDASNLKSIEQLAKALKADFNNMSYQEMWANLGIKSWNDLAIGYAEAYQIVKEAVELA